MGLAGAVTGDVVGDIGRHDGDFEAGGESSKPRCYEGFVRDRHVVSRVDVKHAVHHAWCRRWCSQCRVIHAEVH